MRYAQGIVVVFSLGNHPSLVKAQDIRRNIRAVRTDEVPIVLVGNKSDLLERCADTQIWDYNTSARTGNGVATAFAEFTRQIIISEACAKKPSGKCWKTRFFGCCC